MSAGVVGCGLFLPACGGCGPNARLNNNDTYNHIERCSLRFLQCPHCATNCLQYVRISGQGTNMCQSHATHLEHLSHAACRVPRGTKEQLSYQV